MCERTVAGVIPIIRATVFGVVAEEERQQHHVVLPLGQPRDRRVQAELRLQHFQPLSGRTAQCGEPRGLHHRDLAAQRRQPPLHVLAQHRPREPVQARLLQGLAPHLQQEGEHVVDDFLGVLGIAQLEVGVAQVGAVLLGVESGEVHRQYAGQFAGDRLVPRWIEIAFAHTLPHSCSSPHTGATGTSWWRTR